MLNETFDKIWYKIIVPMSNQLFDALTKSGCTNFSVHIEESDKKNIKEEYFSTRDSLKQMYHYNNAAKERNIDIHKVASCFASVIMEYQIFRYEITENISDDVFLSNARLAYSVSLAIIRDDLIYRNRNNKENYNYLLNNSFLFPKTSEDHDNFSLGRIKTLALNALFLNEFDILAYSDMLYWIELFNIMIMENQVASSYVEDSHK